MSKLHGGNEENGPARGLGEADVSLAASATPARGAAPSWSSPQVYEVASTHAQARRMVRAAFECRVVLRRDGQVIGSLFVSKQEVLRGLHHAERQKMPPFRARLTVTGSLAGVLWVHA